MPGPEGITKGETDFFQFLTFSITVGHYQLNKFYLKKVKLFPPYSIPHFV